MSKNLVANKDAWSEVVKKEAFVGSNMWGEWITRGGHWANDEVVGEVSELYVVYSYGTHFPMYIYDKQMGQWLGNKDKYSQSTTRHQSQTRPSNVEVWLDTDDMKLAVRNGGLAGMVMAKAEA